MKRYVFVLMTVVGCVWGGQVRAEIFDGVKLGAGVLWSDSPIPNYDAFGGGVHVSADFRPVRSFIVSPFYEVYAGSRTVQLAGGSLSLAIQMRDYESHTLFLGGSAGTVLLNGKSKNFVSGHLGYKFPVNDRYGLFFLGKYALGKDDVLSAMSAQIGLVYRLSIIKADDIY